MLRACGYKQVDSLSKARDMIRMLDLECAPLHLARTMERNFVRPLLFERVDSESTSPHQIDDDDARDELPDPAELSPQDALWIDTQLSSASANATVNEEDTLDPEILSVDMSSVDIERALLSRTGSDPPPSAPPSPPATDVNGYGPELTD